MSSIDGATRTYNNTLAIWHRIDVLWFYFPNQLRLQQCPAVFTGNNIYIYFFSFFFPHSRVIYFHVSGGGKRSKNKNRKSNCLYRYFKLSIIFFFFWNTIQYTEYNPDPRGTRGLP